MRVLHCPEIVGGNAQQLARAERGLGLESKAIAFRQTYFAYESDEVLLQANAGRLKLELARWRLFWRALSYDVIHYNFGQSIMPVAIHYKDERLEKYSLISRLCIFAYSHLFEFLDVRVLKLLGKGIVVTYQGDDARQGDYCRRNFSITFADEVGKGYYSSVSDSMKRRRISRFSCLADKVFALNPDILHVLTEKARFLPYSHIDLERWSPNGSDFSVNRVPVVVHAPSHQGVKGTRFIVEAVKKLREKGVQFEFVLVEGLSNTEARKEYARADLLVDQLLAGWYGGLAVEFMALGKPVICYIRESDLKFIPEQMKADLPIIDASPD